MIDTNEKTTTSKRPRKMAREPQSRQTRLNEAPPPAAPSEQAQTKAALVLELLRRAGGASLDELVAATGWLPHTTRAALTGLKKKGHALRSEKIDGVGRYRISAAADAEPGT